MVWLIRCAGEHCDRSAQCMIDTRIDEMVQDFDYRLRYQGLRSEHLLPVHWRDPARYEEDLR